MVDLSGEKYMSTPNAFKYRINGARSTPGCSCQAAQEAQTVPSAAPAGEAFVEKADKKAKKWIAIPQGRPDQMLDRETMANLQGGLTHDQLGEFLGKPDGTQATASLQPGKIRIVGPAFLPEKAGAPQDVQ